MCTFGVLGLSCEARAAPKPPGFQPAAHWASWVDALKMVKERHPVVADTILGALESGAETSSIQANLKCSRILHDAGFESPAWGVG